MAQKVSREKYASIFGPTTGDRVRLADTELFAEVEHDYTVYGEEVKFGGGKVIRDGIFEFGSLESDETLLVQGGAGGVGLVAIQLAKEIGATVYATASSDERLANLAAFGLDEGINYEKNDLVAEVMRLTDKRGVQVVLDPVGGRVLEQSIAAAGHRGRIVSVGTASRDFDKVNVAGLAPGNKRLTGVFLGAEITTKRAQAVVKELVNKMAEGKLRVPIAKTFALSEAAKAHEFVESRQAIGRVILVP